MLKPKKAKLLLLVVVFSVVITILAIRITLKFTETQLSLATTTATTSNHRRGNLKRPSLATTTTTTTTTTSSNRRRYLKLLEEDIVLNIYSWQKFLRRFSQFPNDSKFCIETKFYEVKWIFKISLLCYLNVMFCFQPVFEICTLDPKEDLISYHLHKQGHWELHVASFIKLMSEEFEDILFIDIGANIGVHTLYALQLGLTVWAVEPQEKDVVKVRTPLF